jgi:polyphenol oxidase
MKSHYIFPNWPAPKNVKAVATTRQFGYSKPPYNEFNLADHVNDDPLMVNKNRELLYEELQLATPAIWLNQTHSNRAIYLPINDQGKIEADAAFTDQKQFACTVMTADCLPILLCNKAGTKVAAIHAGWRGLLGGIIENTITKMNIPGNELLAWLGPAIGPNYFAIREDVYNLCLNRDRNFEKFLKKVDNNQWLADIYSMAHQILQNFGVNNIYGEEFCTFTDNQLFFSYRRDGAKTGRIASLIWLT